MTVARRRGKPILVAVLALLAFGRAMAQATLVVNPGTGLAISGFDPVAYFTEARAEVGRPDLEWSEEGAVWRFRNEGNRAAFREHPEVYRPGFGGYDPVAIARDRSVPGHPLFWAIAGARLYFFYSAEHRDAFLADPAGVLATAERKWPEVEKTVGR